MNISTLFGGEQMLFQMKR